MDKQIVITRYKEDLSWTQYLEANTIIYSKGGTADTKHKIIQMPNIGMGGASIWYHIIENYDNLADITLFIEGWPFDAQFESSRGWKNDEESVKALEEYYFNIHPNFIASSNCYGTILGNRFDSPPNYNQRHHDCFVYYSTSWKEWVDEILDPTHLINFDEVTPMFRNGHISLTKQAIKANSKDYYKKIMNHWKYDNPLGEWLFEITAAFIFNIGPNGRYKDYRHDLVDTSNIPDYKTWMYEING